MARRSCRLFHVDAFTRERFAATRPWSVLDADELTDEDMHRIAREINGTEVAFVIPSESADYDLEVRFSGRIVKSPSSAPPPSPRNTCARS
jgi:PhzF family phenazine biosynthesis protein